MTTVILGASGRIGQVLTNDLANAGHKIIGISRQVPQNFTHTHLSYIPCDRRDHQKIFSILSTLDKVETVIDLSGFRAEDVKVCLAAVSQKPVVYIYMSSLAATQYENDVDLLPLRERVYKVSKVLRSGYGYEKLLAEHAVINYSSNFSIKGIIFRTAEVIGTCDIREQYFLYRLACKLNEILLPDGGHNIIHPVDVRDLSQAIKLSAEKPDFPSGIYHLAGDVAFSLATYIEILTSTLNTNIETIPIPREYVLTFKPCFYYPFYPRSTFVEATKLAGLGFQPSYSITDSILKSQKVFNQSGNVFIENENPFLPSKLNRILSVQEEALIIAQWKQMLVNQSIRVLC